MLSMILKTTAQFSNAVVRLGRLLLWPEAIGNRTVLRYKASDGSVATIADTTTYTPVLPIPNFYDATNGIYCLLDDVNTVLNIYNVRKCNGVEFNVRSADTTTGNIVVISKVLVNAACADWYEGGNSNWWIYGVDSGVAAASAKPSMWITLQTDAIPVTAVNAEKSIEYAYSVEGTIDLTRDTDAVGDTLESVDIVSAVITGFGWRRTR